jgi:hypothetical protein
MAHDLRGNLLDTDPQDRGEGFPTQITGVREMLDFTRNTKAGILHDFDADTRSTKRVAYWRIFQAGRLVEVAITPWGTRYNVSGFSRPDDAPHYVVHI